MIHAYIDRVSKSAKRKQAYSRQSTASMGDLSSGPPASHTHASRVRSLPVPAYRPLCPPSKMNVCHIHRGERENVIVSCCPESHMRLSHCLQGALARGPDQTTNQQLCLCMCLLAACCQGLLRLAKTCFVSTHLLLHCTRHAVAAQVLYGCARSAVCFCLPTASLADLQCHDHTFLRGTRTCDCTG